MDNPDLLQAQKNSQSAATQAATYQSAAALLPEKLKQAINEKLDYNKDIIEAKNTAMGEYFAAPAVAREKYQNIWNPFEREKLVTQERQQAYQPYANLSEILQNRQGTIADIINAGTNAFQADVQSKTNAAQLARQNYEDLFNIAKTSSSGSGSGSAGGLNDLLSLFDFGDGGTTTEPTEPKPTWTFGQESRASNKTSYHFSPGGEWIWDPTSSDWVPAVE